MMLWPLLGMVAAVGTGAGAVKGAIGLHYQAARLRQFGPYGHPNPPAPTHNSHSNTHSRNVNNFEYSSSNANHNYDNTETHGNHNYESSGRPGHHMSFNNNGDDFYGQSIKELYKNHKLDNYNDEWYNRNSQRSPYVGLNQQLNEWGNRQINRGFASYFGGLNPKMATQASRGGSGYLWESGSPGSVERHEGQDTFSRKVGLWDDIVEYFWGTSRSDTLGYRGEGDGSGGWGMKSQDRPTMDLYSVMALGLFTSFLAYMALYFIDLNTAESRLLGSGGDDLSGALALATDAFERWAAFKFLPRVLAGGGEEGEEAGKGEEEEEEGNVKKGDGKKEKKGNKDNNDEQEEADKNKEDNYMAKIDN